GTLPLPPFYSSSMRRVHVPRPGGRPSTHSLPRGREQGLPAFSPLATPSASLRGSPIPSPRASPPGSPLRKRKRPADDVPIRDDDDEDDDDEAEAEAEAHQQKGR